MTEILQHAAAHPDRLLPTDPRVREVARSLHQEVAGLPLVSPRLDCGFLARLVAEHRLAGDEAAALARDLAYDLPRRVFRL